MKIEIDPDDQIELEFLTTSIQELQIDAAEAKVAGLTDFYEWLIERSAQLKRERNQLLNKLRRGRQ